MFIFINYVVLCISIKRNVQLNVTNYVMQRQAIDNNVNENTEAILRITSYLIILMCR